jgi:hypothetical protein
MTIEGLFITGLMLGFEYVQLPESEEQHIVIDLLFVRFVITWG